ncbi:hypothetical protein D3C81_690370 [compost metagenome]
MIVEVQHSPFVVLHSSGQLHILVSGLHVPPLIGEATSVCIIEFMVGIIRCVDFHQEQLEECRPFLQRQAVQN